MLKSCMTLSTLCLGNCGIIVHSRAVLSVSTVCRGIEGFRVGMEKKTEPLSYLGGFRLSSFKGFNTWVSTKMLACLQSERQ